jgi:Peptidase A4 family
MRLRLPIALVSTVALAFVCAPAALADTTQSSNWAGYAIHRASVNFSSVIGAWRQPRATCSSGNPSYSAVWVGLGGYSTTSNAREQSGTEVDCSRTGKVLSSAWYELVPAASRTVKLSVLPGDELTASVTVVGRTVNLALNDLTRHRTFAKTLHTSDLDISSAEWIVEAPSSCFSAQSCQTLPLADFGSAKFDLASAKSTTGHIGSIADRAWSSTKITLDPAARHFVDIRSPTATSGSANPSGLTANGHAFAVSYRRVSVRNNPTLSVRRAAPREGQVVHAGAPLAR